MNEFDLGGLAGLFDRMLRLEFEYANYDNLATIGGRSHADEEETQMAYSAMTEAQKFCEVQQFAAAHEVISRIVNGWEYGTWEYNKRDFAAIATELRHARESISDELNKRTFISIEYDRRLFVNDVERMGPGVTTAFRSAIQDIYEAGNCFAAECNTAAVFHLMRVVEWGLRALCIHLGLRRAKRTQKGKKKYVPIAYTDWETMLNQLPDLVDKKINKLKRGKAKQDAQEFYYPVLQDIRAIRDAWRNHVMHTRATYTREDAAAILSHVQRIMTKLAGRVREQ